MGKKNRRHKSWLKKHNWRAFQSRPKLCFEPTAYEKMMYYVQLAEGEISGLGKIRYVESANTRFYDEDKIMVEDIALFTQRCSGGGTTLNEESLAKFIVSLARKKQDPHEWRLWWHSHADFGASWSGIDEAAITKLTTEEGSELMSVCADKSYHLIARRDTHGGKRYERMDTRIMPRIDCSRFSKCEREFKEKVTEMVFKVEHIDYDKWNRKKDKKTVNIEDVRKEHGSGRRPLLDYKYNIKTKVYEHNRNHKVKPLTDRDAEALGIYFDPCTGLYMRLSNGTILTELEIRDLNINLEGRKDGLPTHIGSVVEKVWGHRPK